MRQRLTRNQDRDPGVTQAGLRVQRRRVEPDACVVSIRQEGHDIIERCVDELDFAEFSQPLDGLLLSLTIREFRLHRRINGRDRRGIGFRLGEFRGSFRVLSHAHEDQDQTKQTDADANSSNHQRVSRTEHDGSCPRAARVSATPATFTGRPF